MKALKLSLIAILACAALVSCKKKDATTDNPDNPENKRAQYIEYLTNKKGWVLATATSSPAYLLNGDTYCTDLMTEGYLEDCELDDILKFTSNGGLTVNPGNDVCDEEEEYAATWKLSDDLKTLTFQIPFFYDEEVEECQLLSLTEDQLRIKFTFTDDEGDAKGDYSFTLTYKINK